MQKSLANIRLEYARHSLSEQDVHIDPINQFKTWMEEALDAKVMEPTAMNLATSSPDGVPTSRIMLLKEVNEKGFVFFSNYQSSKGKQLEANPVCALNFFWSELERQVRVQGTVEKISKEESEKYFQSRPKSSQIGAWTSPQSTIIENRKILEEREALLAEKYKDQEVLPKPEQWGGYLVKPFVVEFWQGRPSRLHDRIVYTLKDNSWKINRLAP